MARGSLVTPVWRPNEVVSTTVSASANPGRIAGHVHTLEGEVVAELGMDHGCGGVERGLGVGDGRQLFVADLDQLAGVLGFGTAARHDAQIASPCQQARSTAIACCGADLRPLRWVSTPTQGVIAPASRRR